MKGKNRGEWSEFYAFLRLLAEGTLHISNPDLTRKTNLAFPIVKIPRNSNPDVDFEIGKTILVRHPSGRVLSEISKDAVSKYASAILDGINAGRGLAFWIPNAEQIMEELHLDRICDDSSNTSDIRLIVLDSVTQATPLLGFSIKSYLGGKPTLFNASGSTNFVYKITPTPNPEVVTLVNELGSYTERLHWLNANGFSLEYFGMKSAVFKSNLQQVDSLLPKILGELLLMFYSGKGSKLKELTDQLTELNPCGYNLEFTPNTYEYKMKRFLVDVALGMKANTPWTGVFNATGGHIIVKSCGEVVCFHTVNWNELQDYLFDGLRFEKPSSSRHGYGSLFEEADVFTGTRDVMMNLNLQIRF
jgi:hypothetical protein